MRGFTLLEIVLAIGILAGIILGTLALFGAITSARAKTLAAQEVTTNARIALALIEQRIRQASTIASASSTFALHPGTLVLTTTSSQTNPTSFSLNTQRLQIQEATQQPLFLTSAKTEVTNLVFTPISYPGSQGGVRLDLTLSYVNPQSDPNYAFTRSYQSTIMLRP